MSTPSVPALVPAAGSGFAGFLHRLLSDRERFFAEVEAGSNLGATLRQATAILVVLCALYGAVAGAYAGPAQALAAAIKLPVLFLATLAICFPAFFVVQVLAGSRLRLAQVLALVLGALALSAILLASAVPIAAFFLLTGANYYFLTLLHVLIVLGTGLVGMLTLHDGLAFACEQRGVYPRKAMAIMKAWAVLFAFVGIQMAWNLQPFVGDRGQPFRLFRHNEGNFYTAIVYSLERLVRGEGRPAPSPPAPGPRIDVRGAIESGGPGAPDSLGAGWR
jgi:hypothetical protein